MASNPFLLTAPVIFGTGGTPTTTVNQTEYAQQSITPPGNADVLSFIPTSNITLEAVQVSGDGDALVTVTIDSVSFGNGVINRFSPNILVQFGIEVMAGQTVVVNIAASGIATSNFYTTLIYR